jgi:hypothetical protein
MYLLLFAAATAFAEAKEAEPPRPLYEINRQISTLLRRESLAKSDAERAAATCEIAELYGEIRTDPRYPTSPTLKEYRARLWSRLTHIKKDIQARLRREKQPVEPLEALGPDELASLAAITQSLGDQFSIIGASLGGAAGIFSQAGAAGGRAGPPDYGPDLVDLIQRTIQPEFWDIHGGPGTIVYYRPLHCLVVRATSEVHHRVGGTVGALRAAGK